MDITQLAPEGKYETKNDMEKAGWIELIRLLGLEPRPTLKKRYFGNIRRQSDLFDKEDLIQILTDNKVFKDKNEGEKEISRIINGTIPVPSQHYGCDPYVFSFNMHKYKNGKIKYSLEYKGKIDIVDYP